MLIFGLILIYYSLIKIDIRWKERIIKKVDVDI